MSEWHKARKKPVVVEYREVEPLEVFYDNLSKQMVEGETVRTREGVFKARCNFDYIIKGVEGEVYPLAKGIFAKTYEAIK
jgi:hypothetical protein